MKIDFKPPVHVPQNGKATDQFVRSGVSAANSGRKVDVVDFTRGSTSMEDKSLVGVKARIQQDISYPAATSRLEALRDQVRQGSYYVSTDALVDAILHPDL